MTAPTPIADMVEQMLATGATAEAIVLAVKAAEQSTAKKLAVDRKVAGACQATQRRGTRLSDEWQPSEQDIAYALDRGMTRERIATEAEKFKNYWTAKTGQGATKINWHSTWRNWVLTSVERRHGTASNHRDGSRAHRAAGPAPTGADAVLAGMGRIARRISEKRDAAGPDDRQVPDRADITAELNLEPRRT